MSQTKTCESLVETNAGKGKKLPWSANPVTHDQAKQFLDLIRAGKSQIAAAKIVGRSQDALAKALWRFGLISERISAPNDPSNVDPQDLLALVEQGISRIEIAARFNLSPRTVKDKVEAARRQRGKLPSAAEAHNPEDLVSFHMRPPVSAGSKTTWDILGVGVSWERAREMTAHLRPH
ncbi:hypothetical protein HW509_10630 [Asaia spathodeae]|uniref:hypothetical protein n=1 Tax=Asaia spathodeae TaxID=657016 RepID=UPI002FC37925